MLRVPRPVSFLPSRFPIFLLFLAVCGIAAAGETTKFSQLPLDGASYAGGTWYGHSEHSSGLLAGPGQYSGAWSADDFRDSVTQPVTHVSWWGSYPLGVGQAGAPSSFLISFESATPTGYFDYATIGTPLWTQVVSPGALAAQSGTYVETLASNGGPPLNQPLYRYDAELKFPFAEQANTLYFLKIAALYNVSPDPTGAPGPEWAWHVRDYTQQDPYAGDFNVTVLGFGPQTLYQFLDATLTGTFTVTISNPNDPVNGFALDQTVAIIPDLAYIPTIDGPADAGPASMDLVPEDLAFELNYGTLPDPMAGGAGLCACIALILVRRDRKPARN